MRVVLASKSPRRRELLAEIFHDFDIIVSDADESLPEGRTPAECAEIVATRKGFAVAAGEGPGALVISSDTMVELDGVILGKPESAEDAHRMLSMLSGRTHNVHTGVAVHYRGRCFSGVDTTRVEFRALTDTEIDEYIATGEPMDKAGAYGIQGLGGRFVVGFCGNYDTVVGLSVSLTKKLVARARICDRYKPLNKKEKKERIAAIDARLAELYPDAECALKYGGDPWRLLVMARLSAQCTDARVNEVSKSLFAEFPDALSMAEGDILRIEELVKPCGLYRMKAANIKDASAELVARYGGELPSDMDELLTLPGVGRKIANLLIGDVFGGDAVVCDTHCIRICGRLGMYPEQEKSPDKIEKILRELLPAGHGSDFCHRIVLFGREVCTARSPKCLECPLSDLCEHINRYNKEEK